MADRTTLDLDFVRAQFPALDNGWAYSENAGGSLVARPVIERLTEFASRPLRSTMARIAGSRDSRSASFTSSYPAKRPNTD